MRAVKTRVSASQSLALGGGARLEAVARARRLTAAPSSGLASLLYIHPRASSQLGSCDIAGRIPCALAGLGPASIPADRLLICFARDGKTVI